MHCKDVLFKYGVKDYATKNRFMELQYIYREKKKARRRIFLSKEMYDLQNSAFC